MIGNNRFGGHIEKGLVFFRLFGYGLWLGSDRFIPVVYSERNGYVRTLRIGNWRLKALTPVAFLSKAKKP